MEPKPLAVLAWEIEMDCNNVWDTLNDLADAIREAYPTHPQTAFLFAHLTDIAGLVYRCVDLAHDLLDMPKAEPPAEFHRQIDDDADAWAWANHPTAD